MSDLDPALRALGRRLEADPTPDLSALTAARLAQPPRRAFRRRTAALTVTALISLTATAYASSAAVRDRARAWLDAAGIVTSESGEAEHAPAVTIGLAGVGRPTTAADATARLGSASLPTPFGPPAALYALGNTVTLVWPPGPGRPPSAIRGVGALLTVGPPAGAGDPFIIGKSLSPRTSVDFLPLSGAEGNQAIWLAGAPHAVRLIDGRRIRFRLAGNVLIWRAGSRVYRLEGQLTQTAALRAARTITR